MLALDVRRHLDLGIIAALTAVLAAAALGRPATPASAPVMPGPSPEPVAVRQTEVAAIACDDHAIQTIVYKGRVNALDGMATLYFRFAAMPDGYSVMTGAHGEFEVRIPRSELGVVDLCTLPTAGLNNTAFTDSQLSIEYVLQFER